MFLICWQRLVIWRIRWPIVLYCDLVVATGWGCFVIPLHCGKGMNEQFCTLGFPSRLYERQYISFNSKQFCVIRDVSESTNFHPAIADIVGDIPHGLSPVPSQHRPLHEGLSLSSQAVVRSHLPV